MTKNRRFCLLLLSLLLGTCSAAGDFFAAQDGLPISEERDLKGKKDPKSPKDPKSKKKKDDKTSPKDNNSNTNNSNNNVYFQLPSYKGFYTPPNKGGATGGGNGGKGTTPVAPPTSPPPDPCFTSNPQAGAIGSMVLANLWYEIVNVAASESSCQASSLSNALDPFLTPDVTLQNERGQVLASGRSAVKSYFLYSKKGGGQLDTLIETACSSKEQKQWVSWTAQRVVTEAGVYDDLVWGGHMQIGDAQDTTTTTSTAGFYFFVQLGGQRGGHSLYGYQPSQRAVPLNRQDECYKPVIYGIVALGSNNPSFDHHSSQNNNGMSND